MGDSKIEEKIWRKFLIYKSVGKYLVDVKCGKIINFWSCVIVRKCEKFEIGNIVNIVVLVW